MPGEPSHATVTIESQQPGSQEKEVKKFHCDFEGCHKTYTTAGNLKTHQKTHRGESI